MSLPETVEGRCRTGYWFAFFLSACLVVPVTAADRPDVLMIAVDDLRPMLGCYGDKRMQTPNIDQLAREGILFERAYCQYAKCGTSRLSLMTGLRPDAIRVFSNRDKDLADFRQRRPDAISLARWFKQHGYHTQSFGKIYHDGWDLATDWSVPSSPGRPGEMLEVAVASGQQSTIIAERFACPAMQSPDVADDYFFAGRMTQQVLQVMRDRQTKKPMFLAVGYRRPHLPLVAPKRYFDLYRPDASWLASNQLPAPGSPVMAWFNSDGYGGAARRVGLTMPSQPTREQAIAWNGYELRSYLGVPNQGPIDSKLQLQILQAYAACVSYVDAQVGLLLNELRTSGKLKDTVVIFWSDHGWHLGEQSAWSKMTNFEIATRVPLLIAAPGMKPGRTRALAELVDLYPTLCELTGLPAPTHLQGESLTEVLKNPRRRENGTACSQYLRFRGKYMGRALRTDRYRFVQWTELSTGKVVERELYDHHSDVAEMKNLAGVAGYQERLELLTKQLAEKFR
jgi:arylsulfatase A-like enzyme